MKSLSLILLICSSVLIMSGSVISLHECFVGYDQNYIRQECAQCNEEDPSLSCFCVKLITGLNHEKRQCFANPFGTVQIGCSYNPENNESFCICDGNLFSAMKCYLGRDDIDIRFDLCRECENCKCFSLERYSDGVMEYGCEDTENFGCEDTPDGYRCLCGDDLCNYSMIYSKSTKMTSSLLLIGYGFLHYFYLT